MPDFDPIPIATAYAERQGLRVQRVLNLRSAEREGILFPRTTVWEALVDTGSGAALVCVDRQGVYSFRYYPCRHEGLMLPPWIAYPRFNSVTLGWRMGDGESYLQRWREWFANAPEDRRAQCRTRYPTPDGWFHMVPAMDPRAIPDKS